jgi:hypothetical protein
MVGPSHASYRWITHKITLSYIDVHSNRGNDDILREDNITNIVHLLNEKAQFARSMVTDNDVRVLFKSNYKCIIGFAN